MLAETFSTHSLPASQQLEAWRNWYGAIFEATSAASQDEGFAAANFELETERIHVQPCSSPPTCIDRTRHLLRRNHVDHWAFTLSKRTTSDVEVHDRALEVPAGVPFLLSLGEEMHIGRRQSDERVQLLLSRDSFQAIAPLLDATRGTALSTSQGRLLADYILLLERNLPNLTPEDGSRLPSAIQAMVGACLAPSVDRLAAAGRQIDLTLMERVRRAVRRNLALALVGPDRLCREAATSRSQLYRLLEGEGGRGALHPAPTALRELCHPVRQHEQFLDRRHCRGFVFRRCVQFQPRVPAGIRHEPERRCARPPWSAWRRRRRRK